MDELAGVGRHAFAELVAAVRAAGVNIETIRTCQRKRLLPEPPLPLGGIRRYGKAEVAQVKFVKSAQRQGFSLDEVAQLLRLADLTRMEAARAVPADRALHAC